MCCNWSSEHWRGTNWGSCHQICASLISQLSYVEIVSYFQPAFSICSAIFSCELSNVWLDVWEQGAELDDFVSGPRELLLKLVEENYPLPPKPDLVKGMCLIFSVALFPFEETYWLDFLLKFLQAKKVSGSFKGKGTLQLQVCPLKEEYERWQNGNLQVRVKAMKSQNVSLICVD